MHDLLEKNKKLKASKAKTKERNRLTAKENRVKATLKITYRTTLTKKLLKLLVRTSQHTDEEYSKTLGDIVDFLMQSQSQPEEETF